MRSQAKNEKQEDNTMSKDLYSNNNDFTIEDAGSAFRAEFKKYKKHKKARKKNKKRQKKLKKKLMSKLEKKLKKKLKKKLEKKHDKKYRKKYKELEYGVSTINQLLGGLMSQMALPSLNNTCKSSENNGIIDVPYKEVNE